MRFVIYAYESTYRGLHGIYDICVTEANSLDEVDDIGETMAYEVIDSYSHLFANDDVYDYDEDDDYEVTSPEWEYARILPKWDGIPTETLDAEAAELGYEEFVNKYCKVEGMDELLAALDALQQVDGVGHTTVGKYTIDTCFEGENYETAIWINPDRMAIPAVYLNRLAAEQGHKFWCLAAAMAPTQVWDTATNTYLTL
nr:MAG TPA: hypothetical protein [Caudoviricetes sp.]